MKKHNGIKKAILVPAGVMCIALGVIGIVLPVLPTTPFLLLAAFLFYRSSEKFHNRLLNSKFLGEYIRNYMEYRAIKRSIKILAIAVLWTTLIISVILIDNIYIRIFLSVVGLAATSHILLVKTLEKVKNF